MGFFDFFQTAQISHPKFGELRYLFGSWKGRSHILDSENVEIIINREKRQVEHALRMLEELEKRYEGLKIDIALKLYHESYVPAKEYLESGFVEPAELELEPFPQIERAEQVWDFIRLVRIRIGWSGWHAGKDSIEMAYEVEWDMDHTIAIILKNWEIIEFCGSI